jgi:hypothetical protein
MYPAGYDPQDELLNQIKSVCQQRFALFFGVNMYKNSKSYPNLITPERDCSDMKTVLEEHCGFLNSSDLVLGRSATREEIRLSINKKKRVMEKCLGLARSTPLLFLVYWSGHGLVRKNQLYLTPHDAGEVVCSWSCDCSLSFGRLKTLLFRLRK